MRYATPFVIAVLGSVTLPALADGHLDHGADISVPEPLPVTEAATPPAPQPLCEIDPSDPMTGFIAMDPMTFIDAPDAEAVRATAPIEHWLAGRLSREEIQAPLTKTFCQIGITDMVTEYHHPVAQDDAVIGITYRAIYTWSAEE
ncbi:MAG: hypothetical protein Hens2KO_09890 [Henriciella sp.]